MIDTAALEALAALPTVALFDAPSPVDEAPRLRAATGARVRLLVKRDDAIPFGFGGNKVRKLQVVAAQAVAEGADTLVTTGGVQSNHARATAATAARLGMRCVLVANGTPPARATANALLDQLLGAEVRYVSSREERQPALKEEMVRLEREGRRPFLIPLGASTGRGCAAFAKAVVELLGQGVVPDVIVHASSSGGTQAGLVAGCLLHGLDATRVIGVSADDPAASIGREVLRAIGELDGLLGTSLVERAEARLEVEDGFVGAGYGLATPESQEAQRLAARTEALFVDHTYTAKAMAALVARLRGDAFPEESTAVFWHTGGQVGLFA